MAVEAPRGSDDPAPDPALLNRCVLLGSLILPGHSRHVREARRFVSRAVGDDPHADTALLLTSELVTNAVLHSRSKLPGGRVVVVVARNEAGLVVIVTDDGSDSGVPVVRNGQAAGSGNGLLLVEELADAWGYLRDGRRTAVWFRLCPDAPAPYHSTLRLLRVRAPPQALRTAEADLGRQRYLGWTLAAWRRARSR